MSKEKVVRDLKDAMDANIASNRGNHKYGEDGNFVNGGVDSAQIV